MSRTDQTRIDHANEARRAVSQTLGYAETDENTGALVGIAAVEAVLDLHAPEALEVLASDCATEECDHWDECPTETFMVCRECYRVADETEPYFGERNVGPVAHPCPTVTAVRSALIGDDDE